MADASRETRTRPLGRREPTDLRHVERYHLTPRTMPDKATPVVIGINWYAAFDSPIQDMQNKWWIPSSSHFGRLRGGHAICVLPPGAVDLAAWWQFYDQGQEGACVGFSLSRMMSLLNRERYDAAWLYKTAQTIDEWPGETYSGTSVRAGCDVLRVMGHKTKIAGRTNPVQGEDGIMVNRWATSIEEVAQCLSPTDNGKQILDRNYIVLLNSWGKSWPHYVNMSLNTLERLLFDEDGEATVVTDR